MLARILVIVAGASVIAAATHANVLHAGGYQSDTAPLTIAFAALLTICMGFAGYAFGAGNRLSAIALVVCLLAGEGYWFIINAEREFSAREALAAPVEEVLTARAAAELRVRDAETAKRAADGAAVSEAAKKECAANCARLLAATQQAANNELEAARQALASLPLPRSVSSLPDHIGVRRWLWDLIVAALRTLGLVGAPIAIGMAVQPLSRDLRTPPGTELVPAALSPADKRVHVVRFLKSALRPDPTGTASGRALRDRYLEYCTAAAIEALPARELGLELGKIVDAIGLKYEPRGRDVVVYGATLLDGTAGKVIKT